MSPLELVEKIYEARRRHDHDALLSCCADILLYTCNIDHETPGDGIVRFGKSSNRANLELIDRCWDQLELNVHSMRILPPPHTGDPAMGDTPATIVRAFLSFVLRHRVSGQILEGSKTHIWTIRGGKAVALNVMHDRRWVHAFLRMSEWSVRETGRQAATTQSVAPQDTGRVRD